MPYNYAISLLRREAEKISEIVPSSKWYLFGSVTKNARLASDIDLLVVCKNASELLQVRRELETVCLKFPIDLLLMTDEDEKESSFIQAQNCQHLLISSS